MLILNLSTDLLIFLIGKNTKYKRNNTDSKIIDIPKFPTSIKRLLDIEYGILMRYYYQAGKSRALYESSGRPTVQYAENQPNSNG